MPVCVRVCGKESRDMFLFKVYSGGARYKTRVTEVAEWQAALSRPFMAGTTR